MQRISPWSPDEIIDYNLRDGGTAVSIFADTQSYRVSKAREFIAAILNDPQIGEGAKIIELGCSAGDISGPFAERCHVIGVDVVPAAVKLSKERYPKMHVHQGTAEGFPPESCDILVLCEFLEHIPDPLKLVQDWFPLAKYTVIGHPLEDPGGIEPGHIWSYTLQDFNNWFSLGGHRQLETHLFSGPFPQMVMGASVNNS